VESDISNAIELLKHCEDDSAILLLRSIADGADQKRAALAYMLQWTLYAGDRKDWRCADIARAAAIALEPEYSKYYEESDRYERQQPPVSRLCRELINIVLEIYRARHAVFNDAYNSGKLQQ
jgi:hypothetical protein